MTLYPACVFTELFKATLYAFAHTWRIKVDNFLEEFAEKKS